MHPPRPRERAPVRPSPRARGEGSRGPSLLAFLARLGLSRPWLTVGLWLAGVGLLGILGLGVEHRLSTAAIYINGTPSHLAKELEERGFGDDDFLVVMLRGPHASIEREGRALAHTLRENPRVTVISPWTGTGTVRGLRPSPSVAALVVNVVRRPGDGFLAVLPPVRDAVASIVRAPVRADVSSAATVTQGMTQQAENVAASSLKIVIPVLMVVLLLVFGSPVSAMIPGLVGGAAVAASRGILALLIGTVPLDSLAPDLVGMMGLALGVDYSLLMISRFREEVRAGRSSMEAAEVTVLTTGRAVIFAGCALLLAMLVAAQVLPGAIIVSAAIAIAITSIFSVFSALVVVPAMLVLAGPWLERWTIVRRDPNKLGFAARMSRRLTKRSTIAIAIVLVPLLAGSAAAFGLKTGPPSVGLLPPSESNRRQYEAVSSTLGPGWGGSLNVIVNGGSQPITDPATLRALSKFERQVERDPGVETVAGIQTIYRSLRPLGSFAPGLRRAATGAGALRSGSGQARHGAGQLQQGLSAADSGVRTLQDATTTAYEGGRRLASGSRSADLGARQLAAGVGAVESGARRLHSGVKKLTTGLQVGESQLGAQQAAVSSMERNLTKALAGLNAMSAAKDDPHYRETLEALQQASAALTGKDPASGKPDATFAGIGTGLQLGQRRPLKPWRPPARVRAAARNCWREFTACAAAQSASSAGSRCCPPAARGSPAAWVSSIAAPAGSLRASPSSMDGADSSSPGWAGSKAAPRASRRALDRTQGLRTPRTAGWVHRTRAPPSGGTRVSPPTVTAEAEILQRPKPESEPCSAPRRASSVLGISTSQPSMAQPRKREARLSCSSTSMGAVTWRASR